MSVDSVLVPRLRLAQRLFSYSDTPETPVAETITTPGWVLLVLIFGAFAVLTWVCLRSYLRRSRLQLVSHHDMFCDTPGVRLEKGDAVSKSDIQRRLYYNYISEDKDLRKTSLIIIMSLIVCIIIICLFSPLISLSRAALDVFQVYQPVPVQGDSDSSCNQEVLLLDHVFGYSYGHPFIGYYDPPNCEFDTVRINLTVTSQGRQFDRLALMFLGDIEVFRTSTAEPTTNGIIWTYVKDMSHYSALWRENQKVIFDLGNLISDTYTGSFNVTVTAYFSHENNVKTPDIILPISSRSSASNSSSAFSIPSEDANVLQKVDPRASRAIVSISACGQSTEEFWWSNVFSSDVETFESTLGELYGYSPFREIQLYIDGILAGIVWPFPIIFTGGVAPGFWRPIVGIDAFDLREPEIDISPFLPWLTDGQYHSFQIKVVGLHVAENGTAVLSDTVGSYWVVTGNIFLYINDALPSTDIISNPQRPQVVAPIPTFAVTRSLVKNQTGGNESLAYSVTAERNYSSESMDFSWSQNLSFSNFGLLNQQGLSQKNVQHTSGKSATRQLEADGSTSESSFEYPLFVNTTYGNIESGLTIDAWMRRGLQIDSTGMPGISTLTLTSGPLSLRTEQWGQASYRSSSDNINSTSFGDTTVTFQSNAGGKLYQRSVRAVNGSIVSDTENDV